MVYFAMRMYMYVQRDTAQKAEFRQSRELHSHKSRSHVLECGKKRAHLEARRANSISTTAQHDPNPNIRGFTEQQSKTA